MIFILLILVFVLGLKFFESIKCYKAAKEKASVTKYEIITLWGYGLGFSAVSMMVLSIVIIVGWLNDILYLNDFLETLFYISLYLGFLIIPPIEYVFLGIVHFVTIRPYRQNKLNHLEDKMHITTGIVFYVLTVLFVLTVWFLYNMSGQLSHM